MPDVGDERFPRCKYYCKDLIPEFRARQACDLEGAHLLLRIGTENQKQEGTKNSCPDSQRWLSNMDQWQPNEELLDLLLEGKQGERSIQRMRSSFDTYTIVDRIRPWARTSCGIGRVESLVIVRRGRRFEISTL